MLPFLLFAASACAAPAAQTLAQACSSGSVAVDGGSHAGHTIAYLRIKSLSSRELLIDINGSYLAPEEKDVQRLGLGLVQAGSAETTLRLGPAASLEVKVLCVCMDASKGSPGSETKYRLATRLAPQPTLGILRAWKARPHLSQSTVQLAVWSRQSTLGPAMEAACLGVGEFSTVRQFACHGGELFAVTAEGRLFRAPRSSGLLRQIDSHCTQLWQDHRLFALRQAPSRERPGTFRHVISELDGETRGWADRLDAVPGKLLWVSPGGGEAVLHTQDDAVVRVDASGLRPCLQSPAAVAVSPGGNVCWIPGDRPAELRLGSIDGADRLLHRHDARIVAVACPAGAPYLLDQRGHLFILGDRGPILLERDVVSIEALCGDLLARTEASPGEVGRRPGRVVLFARDEVVLDLQHPQHLPFCYFLDAGVGPDTLLSLDRGYALRRYDPGRRSWSLALRLGERI